MIKSKTLRTSSESRYGGSALTQYALCKESTCAECGKVFLRSGDHIYKREDHGLKYYCSYTCWRVKQREDERREREKFERSCTVTERKEEQKREYMQRVKAKRRASKDERVPVYSVADGDVRIQNAIQKIRQYERTWLSSAPRTWERTNVRRNMTRWERKLAYIREEVARLEKEK